MIIFYSGNDLCHADPEVYFNFRAYFMLTFISYGAGGQPLGEPETIWGGESNYYALLLSDYKPTAGAEQTTSYYHRNEET